MTQCEQLSEKMPGLALGAEWSPADADHLRTCATCAAEWRLVSAAVGLGARVGIDSAKVSAQLRTRLAAERPGSGVRSTLSSRPARWVAGLAAAAVLVVAVRVTVDRRAEPDPGAGVAVLSELDGLDAEELEVVFDDWSAAPHRPSASVSGLGDLTADELERILSGWES